MPSVQRVVTTGYKGTIIQSTIVASTTNPLKYWNGAWYLLTWYLLTVTIILYNSWQNTVDTQLPTDQHAIMLAMYHVFSTATVQWIISDKVQYDPREPW